MKYIFISFCCLGLFLSTKAQPVKDSGLIKLQIDTLNMVDWSFNNDFFFMATDKGIKETVGNRMYKKMSREYINELTFFDRKGNFLCAMVVLMGKLEVHTFEIGFGKFAPAKKRYHSKINQFITNRGIYLGMTEAEFIKKSKQLPYKVSNEKSQTIYNYSTASFSSLITNSGSIYHAEYIFEDGILKQFSFKFSG